jgi:hypothetical protein
MIPGDPRPGAPAARPEGDKQPQAAAIREPQDQTGRRPKFVVEIWASPQLHDQNPGRPPSLCEALDAGREPAPRSEPGPDPDLEPEP